MKKLISVIMAIMFVLTMVPVAAAENATCSGIVTGVTGNVITVANSYGAMLQFTLGKDVAAPGIGSTVTVSYSGDVTTQAIAETVTVDSPAVTKTVTGQVLSVASDSFVLDCGNNATLSILLSDATSITGKSASLNKGDTVVVTYAETQVYLTSVFIAVSIDVSDLVQVKVTKTDTKDETVNKKLSGTVTKLTDDKITIRTSKGKTYTFKIKKKTKTSGKYKLEKGATVTITYDGYASKSPMAKKIKVKKAAESKYKTKSGTVEWIGGMEIQLTTGWHADLAYAKHKGNGKREPGSKVTITYYTEKGLNYATKVNWK